MKRCEEILNGNPTLADGLSKKSNNLSVLKFLAALLVVVSHAYPISLRNDIGDLFFRLNGGNLTMGKFAVGLFFFFSGLYVCKSLEKAKTATNFFKARCKRIFPSLFCVIVATIVFCGLFVSKVSLVTYLTSIDTYRYLLNALLLPVHSLPGVFETNSYPNAVNGALWSLPLEFLCYIGLFFFYKLKFLNKNSTKFFLPLACMLFVIVNFVNIDMILAVRSFINPVFMFYVGMLYYVYRDQIRCNAVLFVIGIVLYIVTCYFKIPQVGQVLFLPYVLMYIAVGLPQCSETLGKLGHLSYPLYLVAFPIQQSVCFAYGGEMQPIVNMVISSIIAIFVSCLLYKTVESKL